MRIYCPECQQPVPADQINMGTDLAYCPECDLGFSISETFDQRLSSEVLKNPPPGAWFRRMPDHVIAGASTRSPVAIFLVPFMCVWLSGAIGGIYGSQLVSGNFNLQSSLFGIPFLIFGTAFLSIALMSVCGKVEVKIGKESFVFIGIGKLGWKRYFTWQSMTVIREDTSNFYTGNGSGLNITLEGKERVKFGGSLSENRRYFLLNVLKYLKSSG